MSRPGLSVPRVEVEPRPFWRLRVSASFGRWVLWATAGVGILATARFAIAPPRASVIRPSVLAAPDAGAEAFAMLFARRYLSWSAAAPARHADGLRSFVSPAADPDLGLGQPVGGSERVLWDAVVQIRAAGTGEHVYTVGLDTGAAGLVYLSVDVLRTADGALLLGRYPALVGPPLVKAATALGSGGIGAVADPSLTAVIGRALRNYLAGSETNLAADLAPGTLVSTPGDPLAVDQIEVPRVERGGGVLATLVAHDSRGVSFTLTYELAVVRTAGRWLIAAIQTDPRT